MNLTPYDTTLGKLYSTDALKKSLLESVVINESGVTFPVDDGIDNNIILSFVNDDIPPFTQPYYLNYRSRDYLISDMRQFHRDGELANRKEYDTLKLRHILTSIWITGSLSGIKSDCKLAGVVFTTLIASALVNKFSLTGEDLVNIKMISALYYGSQFIENGDDYTDNAKATDIIRWTGINTKVMDNVIKNTGKLDTLLSYIKAIKAIVNSRRLDRLDSGVLVTSISNIFYGFNIRETIAMSLEHPPMWTGLVYQALTDKSFNRTILGKYTKQLERRNGGDELIAYVNAHLGD